MDIKIGIAPDSWGVWFPSDSRQTPWHRYLDEVVEAGYEWTELGPYGYLPPDLPTLKKELNRRKLKVTGTFAMASLEDPSAWPELERQVLGAGELLSNLDAHYLVLIDDVYTNLFTGEPTAPSTLDDSGWERLVDTTHRVARLAKERFGLQLVFHPHAETHVETTEQIIRFLEKTDPELVFLCLDTGHHAYRGGDPVQLMRQYHHRVTLFASQECRSQDSKKGGGRENPLCESCRH